jgi:hypothetical protein
MIRVGTCSWTEKTLINRDIFEIESFVMSDFRSLPRQGVSRRRPKGPTRKKEVP